MYRKYTVMVYESAIPSSKFPIVSRPVAESRLAPIVVSSVLIHT